MLHATFDAHKIQFNRLAFYRKVHGGWKLISPISITMPDIFSALMKIEKSNLGVTIITDERNGSSKFLIFVPILNSDFFAL